MRATHPFWLALPIALLFLLLPAPSSANIAAAQRAAATMSASATSPTQAAVREVRIEFDCRTGTLRAPVCDFVVQYDIEAGEADEMLAAAFTTVHAEDVVVLVEDREVARLSGRAEWVPFQTELPAGSLLAIEVRGTIRPGMYYVPTGYQWPAINVRHFSTQTPADDSHYDVDYLVAPIRSFASVGPMKVTVRYPRDWELYGQFSGYGAPSRDERMRPTVRGDRAEAQWSIDPSVIDVLSFGFLVRGPVIASGGPVFHVGGTFGKDGGFRARAGWEIAAPQWALYSLHLESGLGDHAAMVPMVTAASPIMLIIPSFDLGVGAPVRFVPKLEAGVRAEVGMHLVLVGIAATFDFWPSNALSSPEFFDAGLAARIAF